MLQNFLVIALIIGGLLVLLLAVGIVYLMILARKRGQEGRPAIFRPLKNVIYTVIWQLKNGKYWLVLLEEKNTLDSQNELLLKELGVFGHIFIIHPEKLPKRFTYLPNGDMQPLSST